MQITAIREAAFPLEGGIANAVVDFSSHTVSLLALVSDQIRNGRPVVGFAFNSIGRFAQSGILHDRMIPRVLAADPETLLDDHGCLDPVHVASAAMRNEKPGGHGDRAGAVAALELATWDLNAKLADQPASTYIAGQLGTTPLITGAPTYAAGGYYYPEDSTTRLADELRAYADQGYTAFKIKIGGASLKEDLARIETAIEIAGGAANVAVDANGRFERDDAVVYAEALAQYDLRWLEEPCDPLDYALHAELAAEFAGTLATGENLFSAADAQNLLRHAGLRADRDILQMDPGLSYGLSEYRIMLNRAAAAGFSRAQCIPHGGHLINLHIVTALGLGGCEAYPGVFQPFGGFSKACAMVDGRITVSDAPGWGLEQKHELAPLIADMGV